MVFTSPKAPMKLISRLSMGVMVIVSAGCMRWQRVSIPAAPDNEPPTLGTMRLTPSDLGRKLVLRNVQVTADSVIGWRYAGGVPVRVAVHRSRVSAMEKHDANRLQTTIVVVLTLVVVYAAATLITVFLVHH